MRIRFYLLLLCLLNETIDCLLLCKGSTFLWFNNDVLCSFLKKLNHKHIRLYSVYHSTFFSLLFTVFTYVCTLNHFFWLFVDCTNHFQTKESVDLFSKFEWNGEMFMRPIIIFMFIDFKMQNKRKIVQRLLHNLYAAEAWRSKGSLYFKLFRAITISKNC